jgi:AmiR/NasT family two-component response regulator
VSEQARGALSVTRGVAPDDAFELLRRQARNERRDIHTVAAEVVRNRGRFEISSNGRVTAASPAP